VIGPKSGDRLSIGTELGRFINESDAVPSSHFAKGEVGKVCASAARGSGLGRDCGTLWHFCDA
jgi:hypothetical protein